VIAASRSAVADGPRITVARLPDLSQPFDWEPLLRECDAVVHLAGIAHTFVNDDLYDRMNHQATAALARAACGCGVHLVLSPPSPRSQAPFPTRN
jgi:UDP-glucose 4-epimerase